MERTLVNNVERKYKEGWEEGKEEGMKEGIKEGMKKGRAEGLKEGERKKSLEIARKLLASGLPEELVAASTGLGMDEIRGLKS